MPGRPVDERYEKYCQADPVFYDTLASAAGAGFDREPPPGWERAELDDWLAYRPAGLALPHQGWKVHASTTLAGARHLLSVTWDYCTGLGIAFKFLRNEAALLFANGKAANRAGSGKFVTIYPVDVAQLEQVLTELGKELDGHPGPYILSDLRIGDGPLYVRYGGFTLRHCAGPDGLPVPAIADSAGTLVPDERVPVFRVPAWVELPALLRPHLVARDSVTVDELPFRIDSALQFSNGGGVYLGVDPATGDQVVLKEARPHAGLSGDGADAVTRLTREHEALDRLAGLDVVPSVRGFFVVGGHHFLVTELVDGRTLNTLIVTRYPFADDAGARAAYSAWGVEVVGRVEAAMEAAHSRGVAMGDFNTQNVLVRDDGTVVLIDWETATSGDEEVPQALMTPGFAAPAGVSGYAADRYALACFRLYMFLPLTQVVALDRGKAAELVEEIEQLFPVPDGYFDEAVRVISTAGTRPEGLPPRLGRRSPLPPLQMGEEAWGPLRDSMVAAIRASATPHRRDRLFPGDVAQFAPGGGLSLAHGAAGVLYALAAVGADRSPDHEEWLVARATDPPVGTGPGLYDGLAGVAFALDRLDRRDDALAVLDRVTHRLDRSWGRTGLDLSGGIAGIGLVLDHFAGLTGDAALHDVAQAAAEQVAARLGGEDSVSRISGGDDPYAGLLHGSSGPALFCIRRFERTGDSTWLDLAHTALRQDLRRCITSADGSLLVDEGRRSMPYLAQGSAGIGLVLRRYLAHRPDDGFTGALEGIRLAASSNLYVQSGLFAGRAGMILALAAGRDRSTVGDEDPVLAAQVRRLSWHALSWNGNLAFPGDQLLRLSMDLATGTAGVLLALGSLASETPHLPFLDPVPPAEG